MNGLYLYLAIMAIGVVILAVALHITQPRRTPLKGKPLPSDFTPAQKDLRRRAALDHLPTIYFTDKPKSQADPAALAKAEAEGKIILFNVKSLDDLADQFEVHEREMLSRHKEGKK